MHQWEPAEDVSEERQRYDSKVSGPIAVPSPGSGRAGKHARTGDISVPEELLAEVRGEVFFGVCCRPMNWEGAKLSERTDRDRYWTLLLKGVAFVQGNACKETEANTERAKTRTRRGESDIVQATQQK